jgi:hypothetical protein
MEITDPSFNYDHLGQKYSSYRKADPRIAAYVDHLHKEILSGDWDRKYGHFRTQPYFNGALRLIVYPSS